MFWRSKSTTSTRTSTPCPLLAISASCDVFVNRSGGLLVEHGPVRRWPGGGQTRLLGHERRKWGSRTDFRRWSEVAQSFSGPSVSHRGSGDTSAKLITAARAGHAHYTFPDCYSPGCLSRISAETHATENAKVDPANFPATATMAAMDHQAQRSTPESPGPSTVKG